MANFPESFFNSNPKNKGMNILEFEKAKNREESMQGQFINLYEVESFNLTEEQKKVYLQFLRQVEDSSISVAELDQYLLVQLAKNEVLLRECEREIEKHGLLIFSTSQRNGDQLKLNAVASFMISLQKRQDEIFTRLGLDRNGRIKRVVEENEE